MRPFDKVIGYEKVKEELIQICDILKNKEVYETLGARMPSGVLLYGEPGLGKTLIAQCFIEEAGLMTYTLRKNKGNGDFIDEISDTFKKAAQNAPAIIFLDDMDKFANEDEDHLDAEEYVAVQTGIDEVKNKNVFVIATVNDIRKLPASLSRAGRFDRKIRMTAPDEGDAVKIVSHYLQDKNISDDVDIKDLVKLIGYDSCAGLETILNEAAINAGYERRKIIEMKDFVKASLGLIVPDEEKPEECDSEELFDMAVHEAGHLVVMEILEPGRAGMAMVRLRGHKAGAVKESTAETTRLTRYDRVLISLGGKAAEELYCPYVWRDGSKEDIENAYRGLNEYVKYCGTMGFGLITTPGYAADSENLMGRSETVIHSEMEKARAKARGIIIKNRNFFELIRDELMEKRVLLYSDIQRIRQQAGITEGTI